MQVKAVTKRPTGCTDEPMLPEDTKELTAAILQSVALTYVQRKGPKLRKSLLRAIKQLK